MNILGSINGTKSIDVRVVKCLDFQKVLVSGGSKIRRSINLFAAQKNVENRLRRKCRAVRHVARISGGALNIRTGRSSCKVRGWPPLTT